MQTERVPRLAISLKNSRLLSLKINRIVEEQVYLFNIYNNRLKTWWVSRIENHLPSQILKVERVPANITTLIAKTQVTLSEREVNSNHRTGHLAVNYRCISMVDSSFFSARMNKQRCRTSNSSRPLQQARSSCKVTSKYTLTATFQDLMDWIKLAYSLVEVDKEKNSQKTSLKNNRLAWLMNNKMVRNWTLPVKQLSISSKKMLRFSLSRIARSLKKIPLSIEEIRKYQELFKIVSTGPSLPWSSNMLRQS